MIEAAIKHWIYEKCITVFFDMVYKNFDICDMMLKDYKVGQFIPHLQARVDDGRIFDFYKCKVVYRKKNKVVLESHDGLVPSYIVIKNNEGVTMLPKWDAPSNYEDMFK